MDTSICIRSDSCTGCMICVNVCKRSAISIKYGEDGFGYPVIIPDKCNDCGLCRKICPANVQQRSLKTLELPLKAFLAIGDSHVLSKSSSGGAFFLLAKHVLSQKGYIAGCILAQDDCGCFYAQHVLTNDIDELEQMRGSKYIQSEPGLIYQDIFAKLKLGAPILFSGTPCEVAGLKAYLKKKKYSGQLITVDLICHGVMSA